MLKKIIISLSIFFTLIICRTSTAEEDLKTILGTTNKPASTGKNLGGFFWLLPIAFHDLGAFNTDLTGLPLRDWFVVVIKNSYFC